MQLHNDPNERERRLDEAVTSWLIANDRGETPDPRAWLERYPDLAGELQSFFEDEKQLGAMAAPWRETAGFNTPPVANLGEAETIGRSFDAAPSERQKGRQFGEYELIAEIARGGMGVVYKARQKRLNRPVAIKMILAGELADQEDVRRFLSEAEAAAGLDHPGIVPVYESGEIDGQHFFSMGLVEGQSLAARLLDGPLPPRQAAELVAKVADAVEYAHERGVIHRDLKPGNILLDREDHPRVTDFGLAKRVAGDSGLTRTGQALGTPSYMPPEQASGQINAIGRAADVYALGAVLYATLTGRPPFQAATPLDTILQVLEQEPVSPRQLNANVPRDLETITLKCLEKEPLKRYPTAQELAGELRRFLVGEPILARPVGRPERAWRWCRRNRAIASLAAAVLAALIVGTVVSAYFAIDANQRAVAESNAKQEALTQKTAAEKAARLADKNAAVAEANARQAKANAEKEIRARLAAEHQLRLATAERLAAVSYTTRSESPDVSLLLAVESGRVTRTAEEGLLHNSHQALLDALAGIGGRSLVGHQGEIKAVAVSPDGRWIVTAAAEPTVRLWDLSAGDPTARPRLLKGHEGPVTCVAVSSDSRWLVTGSSDNTARVWDLSAEEPAAKFVLQGHSVASVAISRDRHWIVTGGYDNAARVWDLTAEDPSASPRVLSGHQSYVRCVVVSPDGHWLATGAPDNTPRLWDLTAADPGANPILLSEDPYSVNCMDISPDGHWLVAGGSYTTARVWDLTVNKPSANPRVFSGHSSNIYCVAFSADSRWMVTGSSDNTARVWDLGADNPSANARVLAGHAHRVESAVISPDGHWVVTGSEDNTARVWDLAQADPSANPRVLLAHQASVKCLTVTPDSRLLVTGSSDKMARVWDLDDESTVVNPRALSAQSDDAASLAISPDGRWLVTGSMDGMVRVWDLLANHQAADSRVLKSPSAVHALAISRDGRWVVTGGPDKTARIWDLMADDPGSNPRVLAVHPEPVGSVAISSDGRWVATGTAVPALFRPGEHAVRVWDLMAENKNAGPRLLIGHQGSIRSAAVSADSRWLVTGSDDTTVRVWDLAAADPGANPRVLKTAGNGYVMGLAISRDGSRVVASFWDVAQVWNLKSSDPSTDTQLLRGHHGAVHTTAISADGRWVVTGGFDMTARIWDLTAADPSANPLILKDHRGTVFRVAISGDGRWIATASDDKKKLRLWRWQWDDLVSLAGQSGRNFTEDEWLRYFPDEPCRKTFPGLPASYADEVADLIDVFGGSNDSTFATVYNTLDERLARNDALSRKAAERLIARREPIVADTTATGVLDEVAKKNVVSAARLLMQIARARRSARKSPKSRVVIGRVIIEDGKIDADMVLSQTPVLPDGYFASEVADAARPLCFRAQGYQGVDLVLDAKAGDVASAGEVRMRPLPQSERATLRGTVQMDAEGSPENATVRIVLYPGPSNTTDHHSLGRARTPEPVLAKVNEDGTFVVEGLSPGGYYLQISAQGHAALTKNATLKSGEPLDLGNCRLFSTTVAKYVGKPATDNKGPTWERNFSTAVQRAQQEKRPLMVLITAPWLGAVGQPEDQMLNDPWVRHFLSPFVLVKSYFDQADVIARYGRGAIPTVVFADSEGKQVYKTNGFKSALAFCGDCAQAIDALQLAMPPELQGLIDKKLIDFKPSARLHNPGFESTLDAWSIASYGAKAEVVLDREVKHGGNSSLRIASTALSDTALGQELNLKPNQSYELTGWVKTSRLDPKGSPVFATLQVQNAGGQGTIASGANHQGDNEWTQVSLFFQSPPSGRVRIAVFFVGFGRGTGTAWFDDLKLDAIDLATAPLKVTRKLLLPETISTYQYGQFIEYLCDLVPSMWAEKLYDGSFEGQSNYKVAFLKETDNREKPWYNSGATNRAVYANDPQDPVSGQVSRRIIVSDGPPCSVGLSQDGVAVRAGQVCSFSCFLRQNGMESPISVRLHRDGRTLARGALRASDKWQEATVELLSSETTSAATLCIEVHGPGTLWIDNASLMPDDAVSGWRADVVEAVRALEPGVIRFGGSALDDSELGEFEWRDTIGPAEHRRPFRAWGGWQPTGAGLEEIVQFCRLVGAEPLMCLRVSKKGPQDAADQVQYFNGAVDTPQGRLRAENGHPEPYGIKFWQVGNERVGSEYESLLPEFCRAMKGVDPTIVLLSSFPTAGVLAGSGEWLDYVAPHHYSIGNLSGAEADLQAIRQLIDKHGAGRKIKVAVTEWNTTAGDWGPQRAMLWTLDNALACARYHNLLHRHSDLVEIANRSNLVNSFCSGIIQTDNHRLYKTPTYYAQQLYAQRAGNRPLAIESSGPVTLWPDVSATLSADGKRVVLFAANQSPLDVTRPLDLRAFGDAPRNVALWTLTDTKDAGDPDATNTFAEPERISPAESRFRASGGMFEYRFPKWSLTVLEWPVRDEEHGNAE